jgi:pyrroline-5-carboxylate reductase
LNITFIGGGNMARALIGGLVARGVASNGLVVVDPSSDARSTIAARFGVATFAAIESPSVAHAEIIVLAVKPHNVRVASRELATLLKRQVVITIAAGIRLADLSRWLLGYRRLVRAMPNTPAMIGAGITGLYALSGVDPDGRAHASAVMEAVGSTLWCDREGDLDAITAISGSGPAYVFYFLEALEDAARGLGFSDAEARRLAQATFSGAIRLAEQSDSEPALLRAQVTSKGGTTERGIAALEDAGVKAAVAAAAKAALTRAGELGDLFGAES